MQEKHYLKSWFQGIWTGCERPTIFSGPGAPQCSSRLQGHKGPVTDVAIQQLHPSEQHLGATGSSPKENPPFLLVSTAGDSEVRGGLMGTLAGSPLEVLQVYSQGAPCQHWSIPSPVTAVCTLQLTANDLQFAGMFELRSWAAPTPPVPSSHPRRGNETGPCTKFCNVRCSGVAHLCLLACMPSCRYMSGGVTRMPPASTAAKQRVAAQGSSSSSSSSTSSTQPCTTMARQHGHWSRRCHMAPRSNMLWPSPTYPTTRPGRL